MLDHLVIQTMDSKAVSKEKPASMFGKDELVAILKFGAEEVRATCRPVFMRLCACLKSACVHAVAVRACDCL